MLKELTKENHYFVSDKNRDLSQLDSFQKWVNGHFSLDKNGEFSIGESISDSIVVKTYSTSSTSYHTETTRTETSDRNEAIRLAGIDAVVEAEAKVDAQLEKENQQLKEQGYQEAAKKKEELQQEADEAAEDIRDEIKQDEEIRSFGACRHHDAFHGRLRRLFHQLRGGDLFRRPRLLRRGGSRQRGRRG